MIIERGWAPRLLEVSHKLANVSYLQAIMPGHEQVLSWIGQMFGRFSSQELPRVRAWVDGGQRYTITDEMVRLAAQPDLPLPKRLALASEAESFCVTFNGLSAWCPTFTRVMQQEMLSPLFTALGMAPRAGCDFYAFFGNYGYTPFGVHDDNDESLLWHLGPDPKTAYIWPRAEYQALTGGTLATQDYRHLLPHARRFELQPGDLLFVPKGDFHVLETSGFCVTLGLTLFPDDLTLECAEGLRMLAPDAATLSMIGDRPLTLAELGLLRRLALESNGHVIAAPRFSTLQVAALDNVTLQKANIISHAEWPLRAIEIAGREGLLVRGRVMWARPNGFFRDLAEILNNAAAVSFASLTAQFAGKVRPEVLAEVLRQIHRMGGVHIESC